MSDKEYNEEKIKQIKKLIVVTETPQYFAKPISIKITPHFEIAKIYGAMITKHGKLALMDSSEQWNEITSDDTNAGFVLQTLYQRLKGEEIKNESTITDKES